LLEDEFVAVMRRSHPAGRSRLSAAAFGALRHVDISSSGDDTGFIDRTLATRGSKRQMALRVLISQQGRLAKLDALVRRAGLEPHELPFTSRPVRTSLLWHRRLDGSAAHRWLRDVIVSVNRRL